MCGTRTKLKAHWPRPGGPARRAQTLQNYARCCYITRPKNRHTKALCGRLPLSGFWGAKLCSTVMRAFPSPPLRRRCARFTVQPTVVAQPSPVYPAAHRAAAVKRCAHCWRTAHRRCRVLILLLLLALFLSVLLWLSLKRVSLVLFFVERLPSRQF